jgi:predicted permease
LRLTPRRVRERFGRESEDTFDHLIEDTLRTRGSSAAITTAAAACGDVARTGVAERATGWRGALFTGLTSDVRQSIRIYWREPLLAGALALTLALVAGPAVAIFNVLHHVVLTPLPYPDAGQLVLIAGRTPRGMNQYLPASSVVDYRDAQAFSMVGGVFRVGSTVVFNGQPERVQSCRTTAGFLTGLGIPFAAGRDLARGASELVVTRGFALARFGGDQAAIGQTLVVNREAMTIVGVLAYAPPLPPRPGTEIFIPHPSADRDVPVRKGGGQAIVIAKLRAVSDHAIALEQVKSITARVRSQFGGEEFVPELIPLQVAVIGPMRVPLLILSAAVAVVFLIAVTSLGSLVLARAASRAADVAVRTSLGASRWRLIRSWLLDGMVLAVPVLALGMLVGDWLLRYGSASLPAGMVSLPESVATAPMMLAALGLAAATAILFAIAPASAGLLQRSPWALRDASRTVAGLRRVRSQSVLIVGQVALSVVMVACAVWLSTSLWRLLSRPLGFDTTNLVVVHVESVRRSVAPLSVQLDDARRILSRLRQLARESAERVAASSALLPGINPPGYLAHRIRPDEPEVGVEEGPRLARYGVSTGYFRALGIPVLQGRVFTPEDEALPKGVIVLSRSFAAKWFPEGALGQVVSFFKGDRREVIGVVEDVHAGRLSEESRPQFYVPMTDSGSGAPSDYFIRTSKSIDAIRPDITGLIRETDPAASVIVLSADDAIALPLSLQKTVNHLTIAMALVALLLAVVNVYALSAFAVVQRTREIGIRIALGARYIDATQLVMRRGVVWVAVGLALGAGLTLLVAAPLLQRQLFATATNDPWLLTLAFVVVSSVAVLASWLPARRAASVDPAITLRAE